MFFHSVSLALETYGFNYKCYFYSVNRFCLTALPGWIYSEMRVANKYLLDTCSIWFSTLPFVNPGANRGISHRYLTLKIYLHFYQLVQSILEQNWKKDPSKLFKSVKNLIVESCKFYELDIWSFIKDHVFFQSKQVV